MTKDGETQGAASRGLDQGNNRESGRQVVGRLPRLEISSSAAYRVINTEDRVASYPATALEQCRRASSPEKKQHQRWEEADETAH